MSAKELNSFNQFLGLGWSYPCDIWSVGCIIVELCTVCLPIFTGNDDTIVNVQIIFMLTYELGIG